MQLRHHLMPRRVNLCHPIFVPLFARTLANLLNRFIAVNIQSEDTRVEESGKENDSSAASES